VIQISFPSHSLEEFSSSYVFPVPIMRDERPTYFLEHLFSSFLSPRHSAFSGCERRRWLTGVEGNYEYKGKAAANSKGVVHPLGDWAGE
jgi:hypothetical protein